MDYSTSTRQDLLPLWNKPVPRAALQPEAKGSRAGSVRGGIPSSPVLAEPASADVALALAEEENAVPADAQEEALVADSRASLTPAQMVERKLVSLLKSNPLPVSHLKTGARSLRSR
jgi:hypothetical protein